MLCGLLLLGCSKEYDDSEIKKRLDNLENARIPSVESQIAAIQTSLPLLQQADTEIKGYITTLQGKVSALEQSMSDVDVKIKALEYTLQTDFSQRLADVVSQLNAYKQEIQNKIDSFNSSIKSLQSADTELEKKISYLDGKIDMQKDWVTATFTTLTQYNGLVADIATIRTNIETINKSITDLETRLNKKIETDIATAVAGLQEEIGQKVIEITDAYTAAIGTAKNEITAAYTSAISSAIDNCMMSMKDWVNEKLTNYYTIAVIDAKVQLLQNADIELRDEIKIAKSELTAAYENAIKTAIETNNGIIDNKIAQEITTVNNRIDDIETRLSSLENRVDDIDTDVTALLKRIQSVSYIPRYSDGQAVMKKIIGQDEGIAEFDFMISPKDAVSELEKVWNDAVTMKAVYTRTRMAYFVELPITNLETDTESGIISIKVSGENLRNDYFLGKVSANAALFISDGNNSMISDYIFMPADVVSDYTVYYTSTDGKIVIPNKSDTFGANIVANTYVGGQGKITLDGNATGSGHFYECFNLKTIILPNSVVRIDAGDFRFCENLTSITIGNNVEIIGNLAFDGCRSLTTITLPASIKEIRKQAFYNCPNLTSVYVKAIIPPTIETQYNFAKTRTIYVPRSSVNAYKAANGWNEYADIIVGYDF